MLAILKLSLWFKWIMIYIVFWIIEEIVLRMVIGWLFGSRSNDENQEQEALS